MDGPDAMTALLTTWLREQFAPSAILLAGSRAAGEATAASDWDLFLLHDTGPERQRQALRWHDQHLDLEHVPWACVPDGVLRIFYGPVAPLTVLWDNAAGRGQALVTATAAAYAAGPPPPDSSLLADLDRLGSKVAAQLDEPLTAHLYLAGAVPAILAAWFAAHGRWSLPPRRAVPAIRAADPAFAGVLMQIVAAPTIPQRSAAFRDAVTALATQLRQH